MLHAPMEQNSGKGCSSVPQGRINKLRKENSTFKKEVLMFKRLSLGVIGLALIVPMALNAGWIYKGHKSDTDVDSCGDGFFSFYVGVGQGVDYYYHTSGYWGAYIDAYSISLWDNGYFSGPLTTTFGVYVYISGYWSTWKYIGDEFVSYTDKILERKASGHTDLLKGYWYCTDASGNHDYFAVKVAGAYRIAGACCVTSVSR